MTRTASRTLTSLFLLPTLMMAGPLAAQAPLTIPPTLSGAQMDLTLQNGTTQFLPGPATNTMGANGPLLGPTLILEAGQFVTMNVTNLVGESTSIHWHGMHVAPENDGGPHIVIEPGETWSPAFPVLDKASTHWYHPHLHEKTNEHVVKGIAGFIIVRDAEEAALTLPRTYGVDDIPLAIQTKELDANNQVVWHGVMDTHVMVNGTIDPFVEVPAQIVRLRLLNGASERVFNFGLSNNQSFHQIASDGGLLTAPVSMTRLRLAPGERAEVLVDLGALQGQSIQLRNFGSELPNGIYGATQPGMGGGQQIPGYTNNPLNGGNYDILRLDVGAPTADPVTNLPGSMTTHTPWIEADADTTRIITFSPVNMGPTAIQGPFVFDMMPFDMMMINQYVPFENVEIWELRNQTPISHPFHIHDVQFYILSINGAPPPPNMQGRKDVVLVPGGMGVVRFITKFETFWSAETPYMYHCHMLSHEDDGMMGQFLVMPPENVGTGDEAVMPAVISVFPNPANDRLELRMDASLGMGDLTIVDGLGRAVHTQRVNGDRVHVDVSGITSGSYIATFRGAGGAATVRFVKQ
ncbi:MAG: multicopper oxidase domain-containing protein [Flavobacteriales bacterium]|nr:multicopper oxidase domain-containing protein [Flavobacteriales bacterium]